MGSSLRSGLVLFVLLSLITGLAYPALVTLVAQLAFPHEADGSLVVRNGRALGSELIAQPFTDVRYFWGRPSATTPTPNYAAASAGSNLGPTNPALEEAIRARVAAVRAAHSRPLESVPADLVAASASGLDPHISPAAAEYQVARVAKARGLTEAHTRQLVAACTEGRTLGVLGEPRVNVLRLNLALDDADRDDAYGGPQADSRVDPLHATSSGYNAGVPSASAAPR